MPTLNTLLLTGANPHDWQRSSPFIKDLLERSGKFEVTLAENASEALEALSDPRAYQLLMTEYLGPEWSEQAKANFEAAVAAGTGLVVLHSANNAFPGWVEYEKMVGLLWREGTGHGEFHEFPVTIRDREHPITRGVEDFRIWDELYHRLVHLHDVPYHVLATAYSDPARGGSGGDEPMMVVTQYGAGRVFHQVLGHVWPGDPEGEYRGASMVAFDNPAYRLTTLRGAEWAATGEVG